MNKSSKRIWVTQTLPRALESADDYKALGLEPIISPLLDVVFSDADLTAPPSDTFLIFTARNGVLAFVEKHDERFYDVFCVGDATATLANEHGFRNVYSANGTAEDVIALVRESVPVSRTVLHCSGQQVRGQITQRLKALGHKTKRVEYYASHPVKALNISMAELGYVAIYSPLAAKTFSALEASTDLSHVTTVSISQAADSLLAPLNLKKRLIASFPAQSGMLECLRLDLT